MCAPGPDSRTWEIHIPTYYLVILSARGPRGQVLVRGARKRRTCCCSCFSVCHSRS